MKKVIIGLSLLVNAVAGLAEYQNVKQLGKVELYPSFAAISIEIVPETIIKDIKNISFEYKLSSKEKWLQGVDFSLAVNSNILRASAFKCSQGTEYDIRLNYGGRAHIFKRIKTLEIVPEFSQEKELYVAANGDDSNAGTEQKPLKTITAALKKSVPATIIHVAPGVYREMVNVSNVTADPGRPIIIKSRLKYGAVIDGAKLLPARGWKQCKNNIYRIKLDKEPEYVTEDGFWTYQYRSLEEFKKGCPEYEKRIPKWKRSIPRAWFYDKKTGMLYFQTTDKKSPASHKINYSAQKFGFKFEKSSGVIIDGFEIRNCSFAAFGLYNNSDNNRLINNKLHHNGIGITIRDNSCDNNLAWKNLIYSTGVLDYDWNLIKHGSCLQKGFLVNAGRGTGIIENEIFGLFDGIQVVSWRDQKNRGAINRDVDIVANYVHDGLDDGLEPDGGGLNMRILENRISNINMAGISLAPIDRGPVYVVRNILFNAGWTVLKFNVGGADSNGACFVYHNSSSGTQMAMCLPLFPPKGIKFANKVIKNNAFAVTRYGIYNGRPGGIIDYNCYWNNAQPGSISMFWSGNNNKFNRIDNFKKFIGISGYEQHGLIADPLFTAPAAGNFKPGARSPLIDKGEYIRGINDSYAGVKPDIGAIEYGLDGFQVGEWSDVSKIKLGKGKQVKLLWRIKNGLKSSKAIKVNDKNGEWDFSIDYQDKSTWGYAVKPCNGKKLYREKTSEINFMLKGDGSDNEVGFFIMTDQDSFVHKISLQNKKWQRVNIPLKQDAFKDINSEGSGKFDIKKIIYTGFFSSGKVNCTFSVKNITPPLF